MPLQSFAIRDNASRRLKIDVLFEDEQILAINKPAGLPVIPDRWSASIPNLQYIIESKYKKNAGNRSIWVVHRIDAETSGVVLFAKTADMHRELNRLFKSGKIEKTYLAIVSGHPPKKQGMIDLPIAPHPIRKNFMHIDEKGKPSRTKYKIIEQFQHFSLLEVYPKTGRTHQIRVHLAAINCPLAVDRLYGRSARIGISQLKGNFRPKRDDSPPTSIIDRVTLHAFRIKFGDPFTEEERFFEAPIAKDFNALLKSLRKYDS